eukprot:TRINITY_DN1909_c0_g3_i1.p1 TRINITY_DN1909_c0_g3~~TRINITY_DN1909_c0_g3_i1.p1  ORF type:complete len:524 (+),score=95.03 TRINITY_DN1909_c0_g3_i1:65-1636(+)
MTDSLDDLDIGISDDSSDSDDFDVPILSNDEGLTDSIMSSQARAGTSSTPTAFVQSYELDPKDITIIDTIGQGAFGKVYKGKLFGKDVAVKKLVTKFLDDKALTNFVKEIDIMCALRHPNVVLFMGACTSPGNLTIVTEYLSRGSVADLFKDPTVKLTFKQRMRFARDAALGMNRLHCSNPPILHLDLKPANLLVDENWEVKIGDFGLSKVNSAGNNKGLLGSPIYMSPEMLLGQEYDEKTDIYSFGMVMCELATQKDPFAGQFADDIQSLIDGVVKNSKRPDLPNSLPRGLVKIIKSCWDTVPSKRPSFEEMLSSQVFEKSIVEQVIRDKLGCDLWLKNFLGKDAVNWEVFEKAFFDYFHITRGPDTNGETKMVILKTLLAENEEGVVAIEDFANLIECFGPLKGVEFIDSIIGVIKEPWFFGKLTEKEADLVLTQEKPGTYLVRFSASVPGNFTLTLKQKDKKLAHTRISHSAGGPFMLGGLEFASLQHLLKGVKKKMFLKRPCKNSKFPELAKKSLKDVV